MLFIQIVQALLLMSIDYSTSPLLGIIANTELFFPLLLGGLMLVVELGFRLRQASPGVDAERQSLVESARGELTVLLGLLLGFSLPMALPHYEHRNQLVVDEAGALITVHERAQLLPEPFRGDVLSTLAKYVAVSNSETPGRMRLRYGTASNKPSSSNARCGKPRLDWFNRSPTPSLQYLYRPWMSCPTCLNKDSQRRKNAYRRRFGWS
jgi:hypothetical protein